MKKKHVVDTNFDALRKYLHRKLAFLQLRRNGAFGSIAGFGSTGSAGIGS
jgi:hypothetical protein